jgi:quercetin dioxygenase-like cupin family protein
MKQTILIICISILSLPAALAQDPVQVDPAHYKVLFDNAHVRVLDIHLKAGEKTPMHSHPDYLVYSFTSSTAEFTAPDGKTNSATIKAGEVMWRDAETHAAKNTGKKELHVLNIELKK